MEIQIRRARREDVPRVYQLICELAEYENAREQVETTPEILERDGFGENPLYQLLIADNGTDNGASVVGMALSYFRYSTWKGKRLYLEDLIVTESARGHGVGKLLLNATIDLARQTDCSGLMWQVLDWNAPAIGFYQKFGVRMETDWNTVHLDF